MNEISRAFTYLLPATVPGCRWRLNSFAACVLGACGLCASSTLAADNSLEIDRADWRALTVAGDPLYDPKYAIDDNMSSRWATESQQIAGQSFTVDLGGTYAIDQLVMTTNDGDPNNQDFPREYEVYVSSDGEAWGDPVATGAGSSTHTTVIDLPVSAGQYLRIVQTGSTDFNWWSIYDLKAFGSAVETVQLSRSAWTITASTNSANVYSAIDEDMTTRWTTWQPQQPGQFFTINLGEPHVINQLVMTTNDGAANNQDYPRGYEVYVSNDGDVWGNPVAFGDGSSTHTTEIALPASIGQYIRIVQTGTTDFNWWSIHDLKAFGSALGTSHNSNRISRSEWTITASNNNLHAPSAIDADIHTRWTTWQPQQPDQTVTVNLQSSHMVERLVITTKSDGVSALDYPRGYEVHLSDDGVSWGGAVAVGYGSSSGITGISFTRQPAQYVRITQTGSDAFYWWSIYDLQIFGDANEVLANQAPTGEFIQPTPVDNAILDSTDSVEVAMSAIDSDGYIESSSLFINDEFVSTITQEPYQWSSEINERLNALSDGVYRLRVEIRDNLGEVTTLVSTFVINSEAITAGKKHSDIVYVMDRPLSEIEYGPDPVWWGDSYSVGDQCFCETTFDHDLDLIEVDTPFGRMNTREVCALIGKGPGSEGRPKYNDVQCGNGPVNGQKDEEFCPGQVNALGSEEERRLACNYIGPKWNFDKIEQPGGGVATHPDIVTVLNKTLDDIPYAPDPVWWGDSYSVGDQCYCDTTFDHDIGDILVETPMGQKTVRQACALAGEGPGPEGRPRYNDVQCGNGPQNGEFDEKFCPGQINVEGTDEERRLGCRNIGPKWKFD